MSSQRNHISCAIAILLIFLYSCASAPMTGEEGRSGEITPAPEEAKEVPGPREDEIQSLALFTEILDITGSTDDRSSVLPEVESLYDRIIREYPEAPLAQESYWKLITIYVNDYSPPEYQKAEARYNEFLNKYPQSHLKGIIEDTIGRSYYKNGRWEELLTLSTPAYQEYRAGGKQLQPSLLFMYAEAQYHLGNVEEAEKGYSIVSELYPGSMVGISAKKKLDELLNRGD